MVSFWCPQVPRADPGRGWPCGSGPQLSTPWSVASSKAEPRVARLSRAGSPQPLSWRHWYKQAVTQSPWRPARSAQVFKSRKTGSWCSGPSRPSMAGPFSLPVPGNSLWAASDVPSVTIVPWSPQWDLRTRTEHGTYVQGTRSTSWCVIALGWDKGELAGSGLLRPHLRGRVDLDPGISGCQPRAQGAGD